MARGSAAACQRRQNQYHDPESKIRRTYLEVFKLENASMLGAEATKVRAFGELVGEGVGF